MKSGKVHCTVVLALLVLEPLRYELFGEARILHSPFRQIDGYGENLCRFFGKFFDRHIYVPLGYKLAHYMENPCPYAQRRFLCKSHVSGNFVGGDKAYAEYVYCKPVGVFRQNLKRRRTVLFENSYGISGSNSVLLEKEHYFPYLSLLHPRALYHFYLFAAYSWNFCQAVGIVVQYVKRLRAEFGYDFFRHRRAYALYKPRSQIFFYSGFCGRCRSFACVYSELVAEFRMMLPSACHEKFLSDRGQSYRAHSRDKFRISFHTKTENGVAALRICVCYSLNLTR